MRYEIRAGLSEHGQALFHLAQHLNSPNLPHDQGKISDALAISQASFAGELPAQQRRHIFILWDNVLQTIVGSSSIVPQYNMGKPYVYLQVGTSVHFSAQLGKRTHQILTLNWQEKGPTELGGLVLEPELRKAPERLGTLISYVRFLYISNHQKDFQGSLVAELLPPMNPDGSSPFWEGFGRVFTGLPSQEAYQLIKQDPSFLMELLPRTTYASLLGARTQEVMGTVRAETMGVAKILGRVGFSSKNRIDAFDGGPHYECPTSQVGLIQKAGQDTEGAVLVSAEYSTPPYFRAVYRTTFGHAVLEEVCQELESDNLFWIPLI